MLGARGSAEPGSPSRFILRARRGAAPPGKPLIDRSYSKFTSKRISTSSEIGETTMGLLVLAFVTMSAKTKNFRVAHATYTPPGDRS